MTTNKPKFDPSKPFASADGGKPKFDPSQPFSAEDAAPPAMLAEKVAPESNAGAAALEGFGQGASMGYLPQLQAAMGKLMPNPTADLDAQLKKQGFSLNQKEDTYTGLRDENIKRQEALKASNPYAYHGAQLAGGISTAPLLEGAVGSLAPGLSKAGKAIANGTAFGALQNPGDQEGIVHNPLEGDLQLGSRSVNAGLGALLGWGGNKLASKIGGASGELTDAGQKLETLAEKNALRNAGAQKPQMRALNNQDRTKDVGRFIIDEGIAPIGADADLIAENAAKARNKYGAEIGNVFDEIEKGGESGKFDRKEIAKAMRDAIQSDDAVAGSLDAEDIMPKLDKYITNFEKGEGPASARDLLKLKGKFDGRINYSKNVQDLPELQQGYKALRSTINQTINDRASSLSDKLGGSLGNRLKEANTKYGLAAAADDLAANKLAMEGNNFFSLTDRMAAMAGGGAGLLGGGLTAIPAAVASAAASKAARTYGPGVSTALLDNSGQFLQGAGQMLDGQALPAAGQALEFMAPAAAAQFQREKLNPYSMMRNK